ncbi:valine--tRNA ligase, partial [Candidatus Liberibacter asiaticus]
CHKCIIDRLSSGNIIFADCPPDRSIQIILDGMVLFLAIGDFVDFVKERSRLKKSLEKVLDELSSIKKKLENNQFVEKAPPSILQAEKERFSKVEKKRISLENSLERIRML